MTLPEPVRPDPSVEPPGCGYSRDRYIGCALMLASALAVAILLVLFGRVFL